MKYQLTLDNEIIVDSFCGGGGASMGIFMATGRHPDVAINHDPEAIAMHQANHPDTEHFCQSIYKVDPYDVVLKYRKRIGIAWFSPDCTHHSKARGSKPKEKHIRDLAWIVPHWAERAVWNGERPRMLFIENVEEFQSWGPLLEDGRPCPVQKGLEFRRWVRALKRLGYKVEWREIRASGFDAPTIRNRLYVIARCDGLPITWPVAWCGKGKELPEEQAADCINFTLPCPSIFLTKEEARELKQKTGVQAKRPLAPATMRRVAHGINRFVLKAADPFIVNLTHQGAERLEGLREPLKTITGANRGEKALCKPFITKFRTGSTGSSIFEPMHTITAGGKSARPAGAAHAMGLVTPFLAGAGGSEYAGRPTRVDKPYRTVTKENHIAVLTPFLTEHANASTQRTFNAAEPLRTHCAGVKGGHFAMVSPYLVQTGYGERAGQRPRTMDILDPIGTLVSSGKHAVAAASIQRHYGTSIGSDMAHPLGTATAKNKSSVTSCFLAQHNNHGAGDPNVGRSLRDGVSTITASGSQQGLVATSMVKLRGTCNHGQPTTEPLATISAQGQHIGHVASFLTKYYGTDQAPELREGLHTITAKDRFALAEAAVEPEPLQEWQIARAHAVAALMREHGLWDDREFVTLELDGATWIIWDIGIRMLTKRELFNAQGFPPDYIIDPIFNGKPMTNTAAVRMCGNSVSPPPACAIISHNVWPELMDQPRRVRAKATVRA